MCGIVGAIGTFYKQGEQAVAQMVFADTFRGDHSTGVAAINYNGIPKVTKEAIDGATFVQFHGSQFFRGRALICHNRLATKGKIDVKSAHPFQHGPLTGVHNGTLRDQARLPDHLLFPVDSDNIYYAMHKDGVQKTLENLDGAFALVWHDVTDNTIHMARNKERPLHYAFTKDKKALYYASEKLMLAWILDRNNIVHEDIVSLPIGEHLVFQVPDWNEEIAEPDSIPFKVFVRPVTTHSYKGNFGGHLPDYSQGGKEKKKKRKNRGTHLKSVPHTKNFIGDYLDLDIPFIIGDTRFSIRGERYIELFALGAEIVINDEVHDVRLAFGPRIDEAIKKSQKGYILVAKLCNFINAPVLREGTHPTIYVKPSTIEYAHKDKSDELESAFVGEVEEDLMFVGFDGEALTEEQYKKATAAGCCWCASPADPREDNIFISKNEFVCPACSREPDVLEYMGVDVPKKQNVH